LEEKKEKSNTRYQGDEAIGVDVVDVIPVNGASGFGVGSMSGFGSVECGSSSSEQLISQSIELSRIE
jgi:hypothetical protein